MSAYENWRFDWAPTSQPDDPFPTWENLTPWVDTVIPSGSPWRAQSGRPTEFITAQDGSLVFTLNNTDHRFSDMKLARQIRVTETIGYRTFQIFRGYLELPDISDWAEAGADQVITVTAVDRLTRLDRGRKFISTMTEYILYNAGTGLNAYYPLLETAGTTFYDKSPARREPLVLYYARSATVTPVQSNPALTAGTGAVLPGDDLAGPTWSPRGNAGGQLSEMAVAAVGWAAPLAQAGSDTVTVAAWVTLKADPLPTTSSMFPFTLFPTGSSGVEALDTEWTAANGWRATVWINTGQALVPFAGAMAGMPMLIAVRMNLASKQVEVWRHNDEPVTGAFTIGTPPSSVTWSELQTGQGFAGTVSHLQVYLGGSNVYTRSQHLAQVQAGIVGLAGQTTGQRIRTMAAYAGVRTGELSVDDGTVRMQNTSLAGKSPLTPMREAETTEQGLLIATGAGELEFQDRLRRINI